MDKEANNNQNDEQSQWWQAWQWQGGEQWWQGGQEGQWWDEDESDGWDMGWQLWESSNSWSDIANPTGNPENDGDEENDDADTNM